MTGEPNVSEIVEFYRGKTVFISGGTGFIGRILVEHLLRKCHVKKIYMLVRAKKGVEPMDRKLTIFEVPLFEKLKHLKPNFLDLIEFVDGDVSLANLGIENGKRAKLLDEVEIVFHTAATVKLQACLKAATSINVMGTLEMCRLCSKMKNLEAYVHVSTAFSHAAQKRIDEIIYDVPITAENLVNVTRSLNEDKIQEITQTLIKGWPNTYTFTKAVAENVLKSYVDQMPICVVRPGLVINTKNDPIEGWVDNLYGPIGFVAGTASGVLRVSHVDSKAKAEFVPADMVVSSMLAAGRKTGLKKHPREISVYNIVTAPDNPVTYSEFNTITSYMGRKNPPAFTVWYFTHTCIKSRFLFCLAAFFVHLLPASIIDGCLTLVGKKPRARKIYDKIHAFLDSVNFVSLNSWTFGTVNIEKLREELSPIDKKLFNFDMSKENIDWVEVLEMAAWGVCYFLFKEDIVKNGPNNKRKHFWLHVLHRFVQVACLVLGFFMLKALFVPMQYLGHLVLSGTQSMICPT